MPLIVEDGSGKPDAESYISVSDANTYHTNRGNTAWANLASDTIREQMLRKATDYMQQMYRLRWMGSRVTNTQRLDWPRLWVPMPDSPSGYYSYPVYIAYTVVPPEVANACAELALSAISGALAPSLKQAKSSVKVGDIAVSYDPASPEYTRFRNVDMILGPYLTGNSIMRKLARA